MLLQTSQVDFPPGTPHRHFVMLPENICRYMCGLENLLFVKEIVGEMSCVLGYSGQGVVRRIRWEPAVTNLKEY